MQIKDIKNMSLEELKKHEEWLRDQIREAKKATSQKQKEKERALSKQRTNRLIVLGSRLDKTIRDSAKMPGPAELDQERFDALVKAWEDYLAQHSYNIVDVLSQAISYIPPDTDQIPDDKDNDSSIYDNGDNLLETAYSSTPKGESVNGNGWIYG